MFTCASYHILVSNTVCNLSAIIIQACFGFCLECAGREKHGFLSLSSSLGPPASQSIGFCSVKAFMRWLTLLSLTVATYNYLIQMAERQMSITDVFVPL